MRRRGAAVVAAGIVAAMSAAAACSQQPAVASYSPRPPYRVEASPEPTSGPYVVVAVDYHFHDIHPEDHREIAGNRPLVIKNSTTNLHNFTVVGTGVSRDIPPGGQISFSPIAKTFPPGTYQVFCKYHVDRGMTGAFTVVAPV